MSRTFIVCKTLIFSIIQIRYQFCNFLHRLEDLTYLTLFIVAKLLISPNWWHLVVLITLTDLANHQLYFAFYFANLSCASSCHSLVRNVTFLYLIHLFAHERCKVSHISLNKAIIILQIYLLPKVCLYILFGSYMYA